ncbi:MAG: hypothetical protein P8170_13930 [Gemmatimonadota bacterium]
MKYLKRAWIAAIPLAALPLWSCQQGSGEETYASSAQVEAVDGSELSRITLTERAAERLGIETTAVTRADGPGSVVAAVPYSAVIYDTQGGTWVYVSTAPLSFTRRAVSVASIEGDVAYLTAGPAAGTQVVSVGAAELLGTEQDSGALVP